MNITTLPFMLFMLVGALIYYVIPKKIQWIWLLLMSGYFYWQGGKSGILYILFTCLSVWACALGIEKNTENHRLKKALFWICLVVNFSILFGIKEIICLVAMDIYHGRLSAIILPLSISFYTFSTVSYLIDVYWEKQKAEKNPLRLLLYMSFFPQVVQGPIARYHDLGEQLKAPHSFDINRFEVGLLWILWGFFKKAVIADRLVCIVNEVFDEGLAQTSGMVIFGAVVYAIQQYADFCGGIDIVNGVAKIYDIELAPNFERPLFSKSLGEFWRRWHISLGAWMKEYVFYPFSVSKLMLALSAKVKKKWSRQASKTVLAVLGNLLVFILVGIWHGSYLHYVIWGLYNGIIIASSVALEPTYKKWRTALKITDKTVWFKIFQVIRTFAIFVIGGVLDRAASMKEAGRMFGLCITGPFVGDGGKRAAIVGTLEHFEIGSFSLIIIITALLILFLAELYEEITGNCVKEKVLGMHIIPRWIILLAFIYFVIAGHVDLGANTEFLYGGF